MLPEDIKTDTDKKPSIEFLKYVEEAADTLQQDFINIMLRLKHCYEYLHSIGMTNREIRTFFVAHSDLSCKFVDAYLSCDTHNIWNIWVDDILDEAFGK